MVETIEQAFLVARGMRREERLHANEYGFFLASGDESHPN